ncbi:MAG TPA: 3-phosphoshikimate 1-carboxyvinyltransferase [Kiritimatiellia bacterium]|nr:3-phosphoshikimate 1-carboxyvinyltransferase [Kiritimatiellia bacterium]
MKRKTGPLPGIPVSCVVRPAKQVEGVVEVPGDKSISHRVGMFAGLAAGTSLIQNYLRAGDCISTLRAMEALGARTYALEDGSIQIEGTAGNMLQPAGPLDVGNSGTTIRLLSGLIAGHKVEVQLTGDESLCSRPMKRIQAPLELMGAKVELTGERGTAPVTIKGGTLKGIDYLLPMASAQVKSCVLLAGLFAEGTTRVTEPVHTRDHTEQLFKLMNVPLEIKGLQLCLKGYGPKGPPLKARTFIIPGDFSSAAFWMVAGAARPGQEVTIRNVGLNPRRTALIKVLRAAGATVEVKPYENTNHAELAGDIVVKGAHLSGVEVGGDDIPNLIDEVPIIAVMGALAKGRTVIRDAAELRVKESDRIECMASNLRLMGVNVTTHPDGLEIEGGAKLQGSSAIRSYGDHRIAMSMAVLGLFAPEPIVIGNVGCVDTSYPEFWTHLGALGGHVE